MEERMEVWIKKSVGMSFRGYEPPGGQTHRKELLPDTKEVRRYAPIFRRGYLWCDEGNEEGY